MTTTLIAINVAVYLWEAATGLGGASGAELVDHGAFFGPLVSAGQWWRVVTSAFVHFDLGHLGLNMLALASVGGTVERLLGGPRMAAVYAVAIAGDGLSLTWFAYDDVTAGASGAIFGLFGALVAIGVRLGSRGRALIASVVPVLVLNVAFTLAVPFVSKAGHFGGLVVGFVAGLIFFRQQPAPLVAAEAALAHEPADGPPEPYGREEGSAAGADPSVDPASEQSGR